MMTTAMPVLETERLIIRPFTMDDTELVHQLHADGGWVDPKLTEDEALAYRRRMMEWETRNYDALANLFQPPFGDRAVVLKATGQMIGGTGYNPTIGPFGQLAHYQAQGITHRLNTLEVGLFWALLKPYWGQGYATEAARAMIDYAFDTLRLKRIVAMTHYDNPNSMAVMRRLGMTVEKNPLPDPHWFQVAGILENDRHVSNKITGQDARETGVKSKTP